MAFKMFEGKKRGTKLKEANTMQSKNMLEDWLD